MSSLSDRFPDTCAACGLEHEVELWFIVDEDERPDLIRAVIEGDTLREIPCPRCGQLVASYDPLLVYRPRRGGMEAVLLTHCEHLDVEKKRESASYLLGRLEQTLGVPSGETVLLEVPWRLMPAILTRNFEADVATPDHLLRLPEEIAPVYLSMLHTIRHDRGLAPEGGPTGVL